MADTGEMAGATNASEVWRALQCLQTTATVLHTVAHPDDENGALLTWLSRGQGVRTGLYSTKRGEGGANLIGPELFDALGIVRTEEHLAAVRYYGIDLFFSSAVDFGYSKRLDETLEKWDYQMLLEDMVAPNSTLPTRCHHLSISGESPRWTWAASSLWGRDFGGVPHRRRCESIPRTSRCRTTTVATRRNSISRVPGGRRSDTETGRYTPVKN